MANYDSIANHFPMPLLLSAQEMQILLKISLEGFAVLENSIMGQDYIQKLAMSLVANLCVRELDPDELPPPISIHVTTLFPVADV